MREFLTIAETCELLRVSRVTLNKWIKDGKIKTIKYDKVVRIPSEQFKVDSNKED